VAAPQLRVGGAGGVRTLDPLSATHLGLTSGELAQRRMQFLAALAPRWTARLRSVSCSRPGPARTVSSSTAHHAANSTGSPASNCCWGPHRHAHYQGANGLSPRSRPTRRRDPGGRLAAGQPALCRQRCPPGTPRATGGTAARTGPGRPPARARNPAAAGPAR